MPKELEIFLRSTAPETAAKIWDWLNATPDAIEKMIQMLADGNRSNRT